MIFKKYEAGARLSSRYKRSDRTLIIGRASLFGDRLELHELGWTGIDHTILPLSDIDRVKWWSRETKGVNLMIILHDGDRISLRIDAPGLWKHQIHTLLHNRKHAAHGLPEEDRKPAAA